jgi:transcriptional regulator with PAS, ATPase and Fis domain
VEVQQMRIAIVGSEYMVQYVHEIQEEKTFPEVQFVQRTIIPMMYNHFEVAQDLERQNIEIIIAGPVDSEILSHYTRIPYIVFSPSATDFMMMHEYIDDYDTTCVIHPKYEKLNIEVMEHFLGKRYKRITYEAITELDSLIGELRKQGFTTIIGNHIVTVKAREKHLKGLYYYSKRGLLEAIRHAMSQMENLQRENYYVTDLKSVLERIFSGVIMASEDGSINYANSTAGSILKLSSTKLMTRHISDFLPPDLDGTDQLQEKQLQYTLNDTQIIGNLIPRRKNEQLVGWYYIFENTTKIMELDTVIRQSIRKTNFRARHTFEGMIAQSDCMRATIQQARSYAKKEATILINGETGTGKEVFAQSIHNESNRSQFPFVAINCSAIPHELIESELFGYETGSFTGANPKGKLGLIEMAHRGTLFLDDIDNISPSFQAKILRVLQEHEIIKIGAINSTPIDVRFIVATNRSLTELVDNGSFRKDLYYRLNVLSLNLPALRDRHCDLEWMLRYYLSQIDPGLNKYIDGNFKDIFQKALNYSFPGNVRELINIVERFAAMTDIAAKPSTETLHSLLSACLPHDHCGTPSLEKPFELMEDYRTDMKSAERYILLKYLSIHGANLSAMARHLKIGRTTLYNKLKEYGLPHP